MDNIPKETVKKAAEGDTEAFEALYRDTSEYVYNVAWRVINNHEDVEDILQEVYLVVHKRLKKFRFEASFKTWIYRITTNTAIDYLRKKIPARRKIIEYTQNSQTLTSFNQIEEKINTEHREEMIKSILEVLTPEQRSCVVLRNIEGLSYQEIADALQININTVRSRLKRSREALFSRQKGMVKHEL